MSQGTTPRRDSIDHTLASESDVMKRAHQFLNDLTDISAKHGIAISGDAVLFVMEPDDYPYRYTIDSESNLHRA